MSTGKRGWKKNRVAEIDVAGDGDDKDVEVHLQAQGHLLNAWRDNKKDVNKINKTHTQFKCFIVYIRLNSNKKEILSLTESLDAKHKVNKVTVV